MWNSYFYMWQKKYNLKISTKMPLVIRFDGKDVTKNKSINLMYDFKGSFLHTLKSTASYFSKKYHCYAFLGSDEISFILPEPMQLIQDIDPTDKSTHSNEIIALVSQYFFEYFNMFYEGENVFWHGKCFSIPKEKTISYLKFRSGIIKNVIATYFLKHNHIPIKQNEKLEKVIEKCCHFPEYHPNGQVENGFLYFDGNLIDLFEFENGNIKYLKDAETNANTSIKNDINDHDFDIDIEF